MSVEGADVKAADEVTAFCCSRLDNNLLYAGDLPYGDEASEGVLKAEDAELLETCLKELMLRISDDGNPSHKTDVEGKEVERKAVVAQRSDGILFALPFCDTANGRLFAGGSYYDWRTQAKTLAPKVKNHGAVILPLPIPSAAGNWLISGVGPVCMPS